MEELNIESFRDDLRKILEELFSAIQLNLETTFDSVRYWCREQATGRAYPELVERRIIHLGTLSKNQAQWDESSTRLTELMGRTYPEYLGPAGAAGGRATFNAHAWIWTLTYSYWDRHESLVQTLDWLQLLCAEVEQHLASKKVTRRFAVPLANFSSPLGGNLNVDVCGFSLRLLSDSEFSMICGGSVLDPFRVPASILEMPSFALVGEFDDQIYFGDFTAKEVDVWNDTKARIDRGVLALRTFNAGAVEPVGLYGLSSSFGFFPRGMPRLSEQTSLYFNLDPVDLSRFEEHVNLMRSPLHASLEVACSRLSDAVARKKDSDRLLDAVIGLEAILLYGDNVGELKFRFALHYAHLHADKADREAAFELAGRLYDVRSKIAHGVTGEGSIVKIGKKPVSVRDVALEACKALHFVIKRFEASPKSPEFTQPGFWKSLYL